MKITATLAVFVILVTAAPATAQTVVATDVTQDATEANSQSKIGADSGGTIYLTFAKPSGGIAQIYVASSADGRRWTLQQVTHAPFHARYPTLVVGPDSTVHLAWTQYDDGVGKVYYSRRTAREGWSPPIKVSPGNAYAGIPALAVDPKGAVHLVWYGIRPERPPVPTRHGSIYEILYTAGSAGRWREPVVISPGIPDSVNPALTIDDTGRLHSAWYQYDLRNYQARATRYEHGWTYPQTISSGHADSLAVALAAGPGGSALAAWERRDPTGRIYFAERQQQWKAQQQISPPLQNASNPTIALDPRGRVYVAWDTDGQIYLRRRDRDWQGTEQLTTEGRNTGLVLAMAHDTVLLMWTQRIADQTRVQVATVASGPGVSLPRRGFSWGLLIAGLLIIANFVIWAARRWRSRAAA